MKSIKQGWQKLLNNEPVTQQVKDRAALCAKCPKAEHKSYLGWIGDEVEEVQGLVCTECHCPISAKTRSPQESCPLSKW